MENIKKEIQHFLDIEFPDHGCKIESVGNKKASIRKYVDPSDHRPGSTVSGPTMMMLADAALYVAILVEGYSRSTVTTQLSINFLKKPNGKKDILANSKIVRSGSSSVVGQVELYSEGEDDPIAIATASYFVPN